MKYFWNSVFEDPNRKSAKLIIFLREIDENFENSIKTPQNYPEHTRVRGPADNGPRAFYTDQLVRHNNAIKKIVFFYIQRHNDM